MLTVLQTALEVGLIYGLVALALFISFSILNIADLSTDGCFTLGCAVGAMLTIAGHPILALFAAMAAGMLSGYITAFLQTRLGVESILAGIISNTGLYTINLAVMGFSSNVSITGVDTVFSLFKGLVGGQWSRLILLALIAAVIVLVLIRFFGTSLGLSIRATGDSLDMVSASSINPKATITIGLCLANALTALSGCLIGEYNKFCDINLGTGMVTIALASLIIGEVFAGRRGRVGERVVCVVLGSIVALLDVGGDTDDLSLLAGAAAEHLGRVFQARVRRHRGRRHRRAEHEGLRPSGEDQVQRPQAARPVRKGGRDRCLKFPIFPRRSTPAPSTRSAPCPTSRSGWPTGSLPPSSARTAPARARSSMPSPVCFTSTPARSRSTGGTSRSCRRTSAAAASATCSRIRSRALRRT